MSFTILGRMLSTELLKRECLGSIATRLPPDLPCTERADGPQEEPIINPFEPIMGSFGWFETFLKHGLDKIEAMSPKWPRLATIYNETMGRRNFSNFVLGMLLKPLSVKEAVNDIRIDTFAFILRHNKENEDFLLEDLETAPPVELWMHMAAAIPNIPLWKAILFQYQFLEKITGNLFLRLTTQDAAECYIEDHYPEHRGTITGATCENEFVRATYNFKSHLSAI